MSKTPRPAEKIPAGAGAIVAAVVVLLGLDLSPEQTAALAVLLGSLPGIVTWIVVRLRK